LTISKADLRFNLRTIHFSPGSMDQLWALLRINELLKQTIM
jgi:hypothetical protein